MNAPHGQNALPSPSPAHRRVSPVMVAFVVLPLALLLGLLLVTINDAITAQEPPEDLAIHRVMVLAPDFALPADDGTVVRLADYKGQILFLNFWQTWFIPCLEEMPDFRALLDEQGDSGVSVLAVNIAESTEAIDRFFIGHNLDRIPVAMDADGSVRRAYNVRNLPTTFVIDGSGIIHFRKLGGMSLSQMTALAAEMQGS